jgi:hypothetical protein
MHIKSKIKSRIYACGKASPAQERQQCMSNRNAIVQKRTSKYSSTTITCNLFLLTYLLSLPMQFMNGFLPMSAPNLFGKWQRSSNWRGVFQQWSNIGNFIIIYTAIFLPCAFPCNVMLWKKIKNCLSAEAAVAKVQLGDNDLNWKNLFTINIL